MGELRRDSDPGSDNGRNREGRRLPPRGPSRRPQVPMPPSRPFRTLAFWALVVLLSLVAYRMYQGSFMQPQRADISYTRFIREVNAGNIDNLQIIEKSVTGELKQEALVRLNGQDVRFQSFRTNILGDGSSLPEKVWERNPGIEIEVRTAGVNWLSLLFTWLPLIVVFALWLFIIRQMQSGGSAALKFGKTKARVLMETAPKVTFKDVAGCEEAKVELQEIIEFLKEPQKFQRLGGRIPKGALLLGPPGSGKTLLAKAVAGEAGVPFFSMSGSDFVEMFVGVGASRVRDLFEQGKRNAPCITGDSIVTLSGGRQVTIAEMFDRQMVGVQVPAMTEDHRIEDATVIGITRKPCNDLLEITTSTNAIRATGNHLFPVLREKGMEWVRADALSEGDYVASPRRIETSEHAPSFYDFLDADETLVHFADDVPHRRRTRLAEIVDSIDDHHDRIVGLSSGPGGFASSVLSRVPRHLDEDVAYVCGLMASDGSFGSRGDRSMVFTNTEMRLHARLAVILEDQFAYSPKLHLAHDGEGLQRCYDHHVNHRLVADALRSVQSRVLELPSGHIASWLGGMFDGDGHVRVSETTPQIVISAWKADTHRLVRDALLRIGIVTSRSPRAARGDDGNIVITGRDNLLSFIRQVRSHHPAKQDALDTIRVLLESRTTSASRLDAIPAGRLLREARQSIGMGQRAFERGHYVSGYERGKVTPPRASLQAVVGEMESWCDEHDVEATDELQRLKDLAHSGVLWTRIQSIRPVPPVDFVYDLCLDRHHCFVANNLIVHNCIVFIDEIDAVGRHRGAGLGGGHDERAQTLTQLRVERDGFDSNEGVIMIAATNRPDVLDPALLRPGRFDRQIVVDWPDVRGREGILKVHTRKIPLAEDIDLKQIARGTPGMSGADLANLVNEAALLAARRNHKKVDQRDFADAKDKVMLGMERKSLVMTENERRTTAYHEAGHALIAWLLPGSDPVDKVSIIPRGRALGITSYIPREERYSRSKEDLLRTLAMMMGGRAAEWLVFKHLTTGASNDIERATGLARKMVCELGMSENLGPLTFGKKEEMVFLGREIASHKDYSEETAQKIDLEIRQIVEGAYNQAMELLTANLDKLNLLAGSLLEREMLDGEQMNRLLQGETLEPLRPVTEGDPTPNPGETQAARSNEGSGGSEPFGPPAPRPA